MIKVFTGHLSKHRQPGSSISQYLQGANHSFAEPPATGSPITSKSLGHHAVQFVDTHVLLRAMLAGIRGSISRAGSAKPSPVPEHQATLIADERRVGTPSGEIWL
jgi:hypothetical protein